MKKILIYNSGGGLGDSIQLIPLVISLKNYFKSTELFYLGAHENHFENRLKELNINIKSIKIDLKYFGFRWWHLFLAKSKYLKNYNQKFDLIIDLQSKLRNTLILNKIPHHHFYSPTFNYRFCTTKKEYTSKEHLINLDKFFDINIKSSVFNLKDLPEKYRLEAKRLLPDNNYIGFSITQGNEYRKKSWDIQNFITLASKIIEKNKIPVFFIEKNKKELIEKIRKNLPKALFPEVHSNISCPALVTALASRLELAISIDNGVMHMIGLSNIPMIVLFGPTDSKKFAPKVNTIKILDSKDMYNSKDINKISVHDVFKLI